MLWYHKRAWKPKSEVVSIIQQISRRALMKNSFSKVAFTWVFSCIDLLYHLSNTFFFEEHLWNTAYESCRMSQRQVTIWSYSGPHFSAFGLNTERYGVSLNSVRMRENVDLITPNTDTFHAVVHLLFRCSFQIYII